MLQSRAKSALLGAALSVAATVGMVDPAQAAVYNGSWDPAYGEPFPNLYWTASGTFDIPDACLTVVAGIYPGSSCSGIDVTSMTLSFYQNVAGNQGPLLRSFTLDDNVAVNGYVISNNQLVGINTNNFNPVSATLAEVGGISTLPLAGPYGFSLSLYGGTLAQLQYFSPDTAGTVCPTNSPASLCGFSRNAAVGTITPAVPEPSTYALLAAGLAAIGFSARRRRS